MSKRVFELSKELNTTSKRLMEKLDEINIKVKSHMSLLSEDELERLYKHIGVVNRNRGEGSDEEKIDNQQEQPDSQIVRKSIPRIIRKTEIIIHDDEYDFDKKDKDKGKKKNKRNFVRVSSSTDGLMAGLQRGQDNTIPSIRKHDDKKPAKVQDKSRSSVIKEAEEQVKDIKNSKDIKEAKEIKDIKDIKNIKDINDEITGISQRNDRIRKPMDSILSIKKVSSGDVRDQAEKESASEPKEEILKNAPPENETIIIKKASEKEEPIAKNLEETDKQEDKVSAEAEKTEKVMTQDTVIPKEADTEKAVDDKPGIKTEDPLKEKPSETKSENKMPEESIKSLKQDKERNEVQETVTKDVQDTATKEIHDAAIKEVQNAATKEAQDVIVKKEARERTEDLKQAQKPKDIPAAKDSKPAFESRKPEKRPVYDRDAKDKEAYRDRRPKPDIQGSKDKAPFNNNKKPFQKDRDFRTPSHKAEGGGFDRNNTGNRGTGRYAEQGQRMRFDNRSKDVEKPLVIPKANIAPGLVEEKTNLRGERRTAITRDVEKDIKREAKKEQPRKDLIKAPVVTGGEKAKDKYRKSHVIGHTASVSDMYSDDFVLNEFYEEKIKIKRDKKGKRIEKHIPPKAVLHEITIPETISVKNLSEALKKTSAEVIKKLMHMGIMATLNQELDFDTAVIIGDEFNVKVNKEVVISDEDILFDDMEDKEEELITRAPVVVVMGHVDHGKTSLLDAIRKTRVAAQEAGGITQHIGAYKVRINDRDITFLDTPGHEAFTAMRARGAQATDIAILVVAADDGVMPQTIEAINHAKAANVSIIVAINKIDKPGANPDRVKQELADRGVLIEEWGGDVIAVPVSAKNGTNIDQLLEMVILTADILELKANPNKQAKGIVIEAKLDKGRGPVATLLVQRGTLHAGDSIISGTTFGRIRAMTDENGRKMDDAGPSTPVEVIGMDEVPEAGDVFYAVSDEKVAKHLIDKRKTEQREQAIGKAPRVTLDALFDQIQQGDVKELNIIVKADVQGSVEAVTQSIEKLSNDEVKVKVIHGGVGAVNEADVTLASVSNAIIIGFNVRPPANVMDEAKNAGVDIRMYRVIYNAIEDIEKAMKGLLDPMYKEVIDGHVEIRQTFKASNIGTIGGGYVIDGKILRNSDVRVVRNGIVVYEGKLASLKRFKDDVKEVSQGYECGILIEKYNDIKEGDIIESFRMEEIERV